MNSCRVSCFGGYMQIDAALSEFVADLTLAGRARGTIRHHEAELRRLGAWCDESGLTWCELDRRQLQRYARTRSAHLGISGRANMICTLRTFYGWSVEQGYCALSPAAGMHGPTRPAPLPRALMLDQVRRLLAHLAEQTGRRARRDEALIMTGLYAGLRAGELAALRWSVVDLPGRVINIRISKHNKGRAVLIHPDLAAHLAAWRDVQALGPSAPVFSLDGAPINANRVGKIARRIREASGIPFTPHQLRHTFATWALRRSGNVHAVSKALGHAELRQTEIYLAADPDDGAPAVEALPARDRW